MPAVLSHHVFGKELYNDAYEIIGGTKAELDAFILGNQGPDVLFFADADPRLLSARKLGSALHAVDPTRLIDVFSESVAMLPEDLAPIGRAYLMGLWCHYSLDSTLHPFIYAQQYALCAAGVDGLGEESGHEVHAAIESELDELVLTCRMHTTITDYVPPKTILAGDARTVRVISLLYKRVAEVLFARCISERAYEYSLHTYRRVMRALYSPLGVKRSILGRIERLFRQHSMISAMTHRNQERHSSDFDNASHAKWRDPDTGRIRTESFWELYGAAAQKAKSGIYALHAGNKDALHALTEGIDLNGRSATPQIIDVTTTQEAL